MKKAMLIALATLLALTCMACSPATPAGAKGKFIVGLDDSFPPMGFRDENSNIVGFDIDLATEVAKRMDMEIELKPIDWDAKVLELNSNSISCIWNGLSIDDTRLKEMDFTKPYLANRQVIIVGVESNISTIVDLAGKKVGLQKGSTALTALNKHEIASQVTISEYENNVLALTDLSIGRVDAVVLDEVVARYYETKEMGVYKVLDDSFAEEFYGIGIKKGNTELVEKVQKAFDEMVADGTAAKISEKWFSKDIIYKS